MLSNLLLHSIQTWDRIEISGQLFHGCHAEDKGVNVKSSSITGNKWFSCDPYYAGEYCWHFSRPNVGQRYRAKVSLIENLIGLVIPKQNDGGRFPYFLKECFPEIPPSYELSRHFQDTFAAHTQEVFQNQVVCCVSGDIKEVLIPSCDRYLKCVEFFPMPDKKTEYLQRGGLL